MSKRQKLIHSSTSALVTIDMNDDPARLCGADGRLVTGIGGGVGLDSSVAALTNACTSSAVCVEGIENETQTMTGTEMRTGSNVTLEHENGIIIHDILNTDTGAVYQVFLSPPLPIPIPVRAVLTGDTGGLHNPGPKDGLWTWSPSLCTVCREDVVERMNNIHLNFECYSFEIVIIPLEIEDIVFEGDEEMKSVQDSEYVRPGGSSALTAANGAPSRRNPARRRGSKSVRVLLSSSDTISLVKQKLAEKVDDSVCCGLGGHSLVYSGVHLTDHSKTLREYNVRRDEVMQLLLSKSEISVDTLFGGNGGGKQDSFERGFGHNSFLTGSFPADPVATANNTESSDTSDSDKKINELMLVTGCSADTAMKTLIRLQGDLNAACEALFSS